MSKITITEQGGDAQRGRYVARVAGIDGEAELTFARLRPDLVSADHTEAPESLRGTGAAAALVDRLVDDARQQGFKIIPQCSYVQARYEKHPEWSDVFA
ncbi:MAG: GNAT family N-acetyltransferase [Gammaproteobacteria bacterium]|nr:GNAT family N-acetyltransferase [Gammaproteobacteria bacterium]